MQSRSVRRVLVALVAACALVVLGAGSASAAELVLSGSQARSGGVSVGAVAGMSWGAGVEAVLPANANPTKPDAGLGSVSCPSAGNCSAVGGYIDSSGSPEGLLLTESDGRWAVGVEAVLPANANPTKPDGDIRKVSCASAGDCSAVGTYADGSGNQEGLLLTETDGSWSAGVEAALPGNADSSGQVVQWGSVSCASARNCAAAGSYTAGGPGAFRGLLLTETDGSWSAGVEAVTQGPDSNSWLNSVSCASAGNCTAVGAYVDGSYVVQALLLTETAGTWGPPVEADLPPDNSNTELGAELDSVSCASAGSCTAVGLYDEGEVELGRDESEFRGKGLLLTETGGSWASGVGATLPAGADGTNAVIESPSVSCPSAGNCSVTGSYYDNTQSLQGLLLTETAGSWATGIEAMPASPPGTGVPSNVGFLNDVSCASPGNCGALIDGRLLTETGGSWGTGVETPLPANGGPGGQLYSVSCASAENCTAVGQYTDSSGHRAGLLVGGSPASITLQISKKGTGAGTVSSSPAGIDCGPTCSASLDAGTSLTLAATPSPGSRFNGWSGSGCKGTRSCQVGTGISEQTVTATFTLLPKCVVPKLRGKPLKTAEHAIRTHNCTVGKIKHAASRHIKTGHVISQKPAPGRRLRHGAKISFVVSKGRR
jgi:hypothetical protein